MHSIIDIFIGHHLGVNLLIVVIDQSHDGAFFDKRITIMNLALKIYIIEFCMMIQHLNMLSNIKYIHCSSCS